MREIGAQQTCQHMCGRKNRVTLDHDRYGDHGPGGEGGTPPEMLIYLLRKTQGNTTENFS